MQHKIDRARWELQQLLPRSFHTAPRGVERSTRQWSSPDLFTPLDPPHSIVRKLPSTLGDEIDWEFRERLRFESPETFVVRIPHGRALDHAVLTADGALLADLSIEPGVLPGNAQQHSAFTRKTLPRLERVAGEVVVLSAFGGDHNYFHWMLDVLPRIELLSRAGIDVRGSRVLVNGGASAFHRETLAHFGIASIIDATQHRFIEAERLVVPSLPGVMGDVTEASWRFLCRSVLPDAAVPQPTSTRRLFISRRDSLNRRLLNEDELFALASRRGFERVELQGLSVRQQASLFRSAIAIIAPHGAGLTNLAFCSPGTVVMELFSPKYVNGCYWALSNLASLDYWYLLGEGERPAADDAHAAAGEHFRVDPERFLNLLDRAGR